MKRILCLLCACLLLTGCGSGTKSDTETKTDLKTVLENAPDELSQMTEHSPYENLHFDDPVLHLPQAEGDLYALQIKHDEMRSSQALELFLQTLSHTFQGADADKDNIFFGSDSVPPEPNDFTLVYPRLYNGTYESEIRDDELDCWLFLYQTDTDGAHGRDRYFMLGNSGLMKMNRGTCTRSVEKNRALAGWMPRDNFEIAAWYTPDSEERISLTNGTCRVCDAAEYCQQYLSSDVFPDHLRSARWMTEAVGVMNIDNEHQAYYLSLTREYGGIPFDSLHEEGAYSDFSNGNDYLFDGSEALMTSTGEIEYYYLGNTSDQIVPAEQSAAKVLSLQSAAKAVSDTLTKAFAFDVKQISMVYCNRVISETESEARAHWCFILYNPNDERTYHVYIDAETGDSFYYAY